MDYKELKKQFEELKDLEIKKAKESGSFGIGSIETSVLINLFQEKLIENSIELEKTAEKINISSENMVEKVGVSSFEKIAVTEEILEKKMFSLRFKIVCPQSVQLIPVGGIKQIIDEDFTVLGDKTISFEELGLDGFLEIGEEIEVYYFGVQK